MAKLSDFKKKGITNAPKAGAAANPFANRASVGGPSKGTTADSDKPGELEGPVQGTQTKASGVSPESTDAPAKPRLARFGVAKPAATSTSASDTGAGRSDSNVTSSGGTTGAQAERSPDSKSTAGVGDALDALEASVGGPQLVAPRTTSQFEDETPADKPLRDLEFIDSEPEEAQKAMRSYVKSLDSVYDLLHDPELLRNVISSLIIELKSNPQYINKNDPKRSLIAPDDVATWIRVMRESMGLAAIKKSEKKAPRKAAASKKVDMDMLADLDSLMGVGEIE